LAYQKQQLETCQNAELKKKGGGLGISKRLASNKLGSRVGKTGKRRGGRGVKGKGGGKNLWNRYLGGEGGGNNIA